MWLITVDVTGTPHTLPVGFLWDEAQSNFLIYSADEEDRDRLLQIQQNPKVDLHFNLDLSGRLLYPDWRGEGEPGRSLL